jgi:hypothetical protein
MSAGRLIQVNSYQVTAPEASLNIGGIDDNSVYMLVCNNVNVASQNADVNMRVGTSSAEETSGVYDYVSHNLYTGGTYPTNSQGSVGYWPNVFINMQSTLGNGNAIMYLHDWYDSNKYSRVIFDNVHTYTGATHIYGVQGGGIHRIAASYTDVYLGFGGNITSGNFGLYKLI